jgi:hypothetical protein
VGTFRVVAGEVVVENRLHFADGLELGAPAFEPEMLVEQGAVKALGDAVGLRPLDPRGAVLDLLKLQEQLVRVLVGAAAVFPAIVRKNHLDPGVVGLEGRKHVGVHQVHGGDRQLRGIEPRPAIARVAVDGGLQIDLAHPLEGAHEEGIDRHQGAGVRGLDVPLAELRAEAFERPDLLVLQFDAAFGRLFFEPEQAFVLGGQAMAQPYAPHPDVIDYIECFYNPKRRHSTLGYINPIEFERKAGLA